MLYSPTIISSPNSPYNLHIQPAPADIAPYFDPQPSSKATLPNYVSPPSSTTEKSEGPSPSDSDSDCGIGRASRSLQRLSMAEEQREGNEQDKGKGKATSRNTSPSGSSSQGDMADNEMEAVPSQTSEPTEAPPPPKKKRTRTLTTPHQAAVLHALLAQSRFPTTAMREEVGRAIGLSARKVQIWFQNQRQKARRPRGQNVPPLTRPPQYGPFPSVPSSFTHGEIGAAAGASLPESSHSAQLRGGPFTSPHSADFDPAWRELHSPEGFQRTGFTSQLSGPGIPGSTTSPSSPEDFRDATHALLESVRPRTSHHSVTPRRHTVTRPWTSEHREPLHAVSRPSSAAHRHSTDFTVRLPPLRLSRPRSRTFAEHGAPHNLSSPRHGRLSASPTRLPPLQTDAPFTHEASLRLPPPFTLQPQPLWDDPSFSPYRRPTSRIAQQSPMASHEFITLPPPSGHEGNTTLPSAHFSAATSSPAAPSFRPASPHPSLPGPSFSWGVRRPDDDNTSRDYDAPR
ncbi:hypothetical protein BDY19DRAFT_375651 [Irpex rosettiformis]|uniref:Uncharacterized protein n=1 Tax=Irpex rosettiformis TaxID=378272 RepID=A0ACB8TVS6_9APHY|nr:hypothetical protein BDY19DRAFT_375651 [Irpex rosettiformis]